MQEDRRRAGSRVIAALLISGLLGLHWAAWASYRQWEIYGDMTAWRPAEGALLSLGFDAFYATARGSGGWRYPVACRYTFAAGGKTYEGYFYGVNAGDFGDPDVAERTINQELQLKHPEWRSEGSGLTLHRTLLNAKGTKVRVLYYPPDPSHAALVNGAGAGSDAESLATSFFGMFALLGDVVAALVAWSTLDDWRRERRYRQRESQRPLATAGACDGLIPLLDEGIAAAQALAAGAKPGLRQDLERLAREFGDMRRQAAARTLRMDDSGLGLYRRFEWEPAEDDPPARRFRKALRKVDDFYDGNIVLRRAPGRR